MGSTVDPAAVSDPDIEKLRGFSGVTATGTFVEVGNIGASTVRGDASDNVPLVLADRGALLAWQIRTGKGRVFSLNEDAYDLSVVMVGSALALRMHLRVGDSISVQGRHRRVVGVIDDAPGRRQALLGLVVPLPKTARSPATRQIAVGVAPGYLSEISRVAPAVLYPSHPERLTVVALPDVGELRRGVTDDLGALLLGLGGFSLAAGAISIAATTSLGVLRRSEEIAVRRALGARKSDVAGQVLLECADDGAFAGVCGVLLGVTVVCAIAAVESWPLIIRWLWLVLAPLLGTLVGVVAGVVPSIRAARVDPARALATPA